MTSNQVANAANRINERAVEESIRHNQALEAETATHNRNTEDLTKLSLELEDRKLSIDKTYKQEQLRIQEEYNKLYLALQEAQGNRRLEIESQLAAIKHAEQVNDANYKLEMEMIAQREADIKQQAQDEIGRHNLVLEQYEGDKLDLTAWANRLEEKRIEYQNSYWNASIALGNLQAVYGEAQSLRNYELGLANIQKDYAISTAQLERDLAIMPSELKKNAAQTFSYYLQGIGSLFKPVSTLAPWAFGKF